MMFFRKKFIDVNDKFLEMRDGEFFAWCDDDKRTGRVFSVKKSSVELAELQERISDSFSVVYGAVCESDGSFKKLLEPVEIVYCDINGFYTLHALMKGNPRQKMALYKIFRRG